MTAPAHFHETDPSGLQTLERFAQASRFNRWMFDTIQPHCKGHVLEVGSGIGNLSRHFLHKGFCLTLTDLRDEYLNILHRKLGNHPGVDSIRHLDLASTRFDQQYGDLANRFDTVVALNVVEHIEDGGLAITNCARMLKPGGRLVVLVPAYPFLYNQFDEELGHYVRYTSRSLRQLLQQQRLEVLHTQYFNAVGIAGWLINGALFRKRLIPKRQLQLFDKMVPVIRFVDSITFHSMGLSVFSVARKPA